jgi:hypothetical protein
MTLLLETKKWLLNEIKRQQQEDDKMKKSLDLRKSTAVPNEKETEAKGEDVIKENTDQTYAFVVSNLPKTIIHMQQPIIDLYSAESSSVHRGESSTSGWYPSLMGVFMGLNSLPKRPSTLGMTF